MIRSCCCICIVVILVSFFSSFLRWAFSCLQLSWFSLGFRLDGVSMSGIDDVFKWSGVCAFFPSDFGGLHAKKVHLFGAGSFG
jgi:hypothetical protein